MSRLQEQLNEHRETSTAKRPAQINERMAGGAQELADLGIAEQALRVGGDAPGFTLPEVRGDSVVLSRVLESGPAVLVFYRGVW